MSQAISQDIKLSSFHRQLLFLIQHFLWPKPHFYIVFYIAKVLEIALSSSSAFYTQRKNCGCPTHMDDNPKLQGHLNLFVKHHSLEELFTYMYRKNTAALLINILTSTIPGHQACSKLCVSSFLVQRILQGKEHDASSIINLQVSSKSLHTLHRYHTFLLFQWADIQTVTNSIGQFCTSTGNAISVISC